MNENAEWETFLAPLLQPELEKEDRLLSGVAIIHKSSVLYSDGCLASISCEEDIAQFVCIFDDKEGEDEVQTHLIYDLIRKLCDTYILQQQTTFHVKKRSFFLHRKTACMVCMVSKERKFGLVASNLGAALGIVLAVFSWPTLPQQCVPFVERFSSQCRK